MAELPDFFGDRPAAAPMEDFFSGRGGIADRPPRTEDMLIRHQKDGRPKIWVPQDCMVPGSDLEFETDENGDIVEMGLENLLPGTRVIVPGGMTLHKRAGKQWFYSRPSSWGDVLEDTTNLHRWETRTVVDGFVMQGDQSSTLRLEWAALDREDKAKFRNAAWALCMMAKGLVTTADRKGTAIHAVTERHDHGLDVRCPDEYKPHLAEWIRLTRHFKIADLFGEPGIECFVVNDEISTGGTFDRLVRYKPCPMCGCRYYILDLKSGKVLFGQIGVAVQLGIYANSLKYDVVPNGEMGGAYPGMRRPMPDEVCRCRGIVINIPIETGVGTMQWVNIREGWEVARTLARAVRELRASGTVWMREDEPEADLLGEIEDAYTKDDVNAVWRRNRHLWDQDKDTYMAAAEARLASLNEGANA